MTRNQNFFTDRAMQLATAFLHRVIRKEPAALGKLKRSGAQWCDPKFGFTLLHIAATNEKLLAAIPLLVDVGAPLNAQEKNAGQTALHLAVCLRNDRAVALLSSMKGIDMNVQDENGATPLHYAAQGGAENNVDFLLQAGAEPCIRNDRGETPADEVSRFVLYPSRRERLLKKLTPCGRCEIKQKAKTRGENPIYACIVG